MSCVSKVLDDTVSVENFSCNKKPESDQLENFLKVHALDNQHKQLTVTYVALTEDDNPIAFFSIACASIAVNNLEKKQTSNLPGRDRYPAIYIGRFAVDDKYQNQGVGVWLMEQLFARAINISFDVGCRYLIVQSKQTAKTFYEKKFGFSHAKDLDNGHILYYKNMITL
ncbi:GNAT family N-acetyltransferase, partial [Methanoregula sp.]|uniref:GNAT family N-acetyltransferase n=1 Tax=Methanoregula sp. TaxID=2052170 RepID=UPI003C795365